MFKKILIANRGEIAVRIAATARRMGIRTVAVYSEADSQAWHVHACDEAIAIGPAAARDSYLQGSRIIEAALQSGAQALHPGYGFLSENQRFAAACVQAGLVFVGPSASAMAAMGNKSAAKRLMQAAGVPLVPGYHGDQQDSAFLQLEAERIGYPVLIKASSGGGGKGMRVVHDAADFACALASCQREAAASFGDQQVLIERYLQRPRHIEMQIFGDQQGQYVHLFERDCSVQRRHQKILEEAPAAGMTAQRRAQMGAAAIAAARSVAYVGAGTVEFICDCDGHFYFMEMNTRLQVEHPVTEAITGLDLVEWQLRVACGEPLPATQEQLQIRGHAIEARLCAENPAQQFLPATGRIRVFATPSAASFSAAPLRLDSGVRAGDTVSAHYDSMLAKLIVWGETREHALAQLEHALAHTHIVGLHSNVQFLRRVLSSAAFASADLDTSLIEREHAWLFDAPGPDRHLVCAAVVARLLSDESASEDRDSWSRHDGWRLHGGAQRRVYLEIDAQVDTATVLYPRQAAPRLQIGASILDLQATALGADRWALNWGPRRVTVAVYRDGAHFDVFVPDGHARVLLVGPQHAQTDPAEARPPRLLAQMPGKVMAIHVRVGQAVKKGAPLLVTEAMKMEHTLTAPQDGVVQDVLCAIGDQIADGSELIRLQPPSEFPHVP